ncbi:hypothetical protein LTR85_004335 [Meristemomyces frigidus]|nr:hypothetical protein LTR85_004335 [Meristemomyces frigidus]
MEASPLKRVPAELRNRIYELALHKPEGIIVRSYVPKMWARRYVSIGLTMTCRELRRDATSMFYATNIFSIVADFFEHNDGPLDLAYVEYWRRTIGPSNAGSLERLHLELGTYDGRTAYSRAEFPASYLPFNMCSRLFDQSRTAVHLDFTIIYHTAPTGGTKAVHIVLPLGNIDEALSCIRSTVAEERWLLLDGDANYERHASGPCAWSRATLSKHYNPPVQLASLPGPPVPGQPHRYPGPPSPGLRRHISVAKRLSMPRSDGYRDAQWNLLDWQMILENAVLEGLFGRAEG